MTLTIAQTATAVGTLVPASFLAGGGLPPYNYFVLPGGAGGVIDVDTGAYMSPATISTSPKQTIDTIRVIDQLGDEATTTISIGSPIRLLMDILAHELDLPQERIYLFNQKIMQPADQSLYIAIEVPMLKPFGSTALPVDAGVGQGLDVKQSVNFVADVCIDMISRNTEALERQAEVVMALKSTYAQRQQSANLFYISTLPDMFMNIAGIDGTAIPYRYRAKIRLQFSVKKMKAAEYYDQFVAPLITVDAFIPQVIDYIYGGDDNQTVDNSIDAGVFDDDIDNFIVGGGP